MTAAVMSVSVSCSHAAEAQEPSQPSALVAPLIKQLEDPSEEVRGKATAALAQLGKQALPSLMEAAESDTGYIRLHALQAIGKMGPDAKPAIPVLIKQLNNKDSGSRILFAAAFALGNIGPEAAEAAPALAQHLDRDWNFAGPHFEPALRKLGPGAAPAMIAALSKTKNDRDTQTLVALLTECGSKYALPLFEHESPVIREAVTRSMSRHKEGMKPIIALLDDKNEKVRAVAAYVLRSYGKDAVVAQGKLLAMLSDESIVIRESSVWGISGIEADPKQVHGPLLKVAQDPHIALAAGLALDQYGFHEDAIGSWITALQSENYIYRYGAAMRLGAKSKAASAAVPALTAALADEQGNVRAYAAEALGKIGPAAKAALPQLRKLTQDDYGLARSMALEAVGRIEAAK